MNSATSPSHYQHGKYETIIKMLIIFGPEKTKAFCDLNVFKYTDRMNYKNTPEEDQEKIDMYAAISAEIDTDLSCADNAQNIALLLRQLRAEKKGRPVWALDFPEAFNPE